MGRATGPLLRCAGAAAFAAVACLASCAPLFEPAYGTGISYARQCSGFICNDAALMRTVREVREGDIVQGGRLYPTVSYAGWTITAITGSGVELRPSPESSERVFLGYGEQDAVERPSPAPYNFESSLVFERGRAPGTAVMTILEKPDYPTQYPAPAYPPGP